MRMMMLMMMAGAMALSPALAERGGGNGSNAMGSTNGAGWGRGPTSTGQPGLECEDLIEDQEGAFPGKAADNGSSAFGGFASTRYAGTQPQNTVNLATSSQYDTACGNQEPAE